MSGLIRVRLRFDSTPVSYAQKCWFTFNSEKCKLVADVSHLIASHFNLQDAKGLQLFMDDYLIPTNECAQIIRDNDTIQVKMVQRRLVSSSSGDEESGSSSDDPQPVAKRGRIQKKAVETSDRTLKNANQPPRPQQPTVKKLVGVTKKLTSGGSHTVFHSSSSSSYSSSDSSSSSSSSSRESVKKTTRVKTPPSRIETQWDKKKQTPLSKVAAAIGTAKCNDVGASAGKVANSIDKSSSLMNARRFLSNVAAASAGLWNKPSTNAINGMGRGTNTGKRSRRRKRANRGGNIPSDVIVGGPADILTTKSTLYINPSDKVADTNAAETSKNDSSHIEPVTGASDGEIEAQMVNGDMLLEEGESKEPSKLAVEPVKDYSSFPDLQGPPRVGDKLAFKILELSSTYTPEVSGFLEATVVNFDPVTSTTKLKYTENTLQKLSQRGDDSKSGKFAIIMEQEEAAPLEIQQEVNLSITELLEPKLIT